MKDRLREAVFNVLGTDVEGRIAIDLFAGTGALGLEAISRGAERAILIERHFPTAQLIQRSVRELGVADRAEVVFGDAFTWSQQYRPPPAARLLVFCSPPYDFYRTRGRAMRELVRHWMELPADTLLVVEAEADFDWQQLPLADTWQVRPYPPASIGLWHSTAPENGPPGKRRD